MCLQDEYTIWFKTEQFVSTPDTNDGNENQLGNMLSWTGTVSGSESWALATPLPSPYVYIFSSASCVPADSPGASGQVGMTWGADLVIIAPPENMDAVNTKAEVLSWIEESELGLTELLRSSTETSLSKLAVAVNSASTDSENADEQSSMALALSIVALCFNVLLLGVLIGLVALRFAKPRTFTRAILPDAVLTSDRNPAHDEKSADQLEVEVEEGL